MKTWYYKLDDKELEISEEELVEAIEKKELPRELFIRDESSNQRVF